MADKELRELFASNLKYWLERRGKTQADLRRYMEVSSATASDWCNGRKIPRTDKLSVICDWLGIDLKDLLTDNGKEVDVSYYFNTDAREYAELLFHHPEYKVLFDAARTVPAKDIDLVRQLIERFSEHHDD